LRYTCAKENQTHSSGGNSRVSQAANVRRNRPGFDHGGNPAAGQQKTK